MDSVHTHSLRLLPRLMGDTTGPERHSSLRGATLQGEEGGRESQVERTGEERRAGCKEAEKDTVQIQGHQKGSETRGQVKRAQRKIQDAPNLYLKIILLPV